MAGDAATAVDPHSNPQPEPAPKKSRGLLSRIWRAIFGGRGDDYEKRLQYLSKEEAAVHARMKRRALNSRRSIRHLVGFSVLLEIAAVIYAIMTTRLVELRWQMRALRVLPMFLLPFLSTLLYSLIISITRVVDRKDQKTLEKLRAERKAKIDELKERTNYYSTQQLIQKYDLDPAAKAAAATVLASKLGADSGLKVFVGDEQNVNALGKSSDAELLQSEGLRNRKGSHARSNSAGSAVTSQIVGEASTEFGGDSQIASQGQRVVEHYKPSGSTDGGWLARIAALLVGEDPSQCYALICGNCHMHNGLARKEDFAHITYYCPHCHALNTSGQSGGESGGRSSQPSSGMASPLAPVLEDRAENSSKGSDIAKKTAAGQE